MGKVVIKVHGKTKTFDSYKEAAKFFGIHRDTIRKRMNRGWTLEQAVGIETPPSKKPQTGNETSVLVDGVEKTFCSFHAACREFGVGFSTARERVKSLGWTIEQALGIEVPPEYAKYVYGLIYLVTHVESGKKYVGQTKQRLNRRWRNHYESAEKDPEIYEYAAKDQKRPLIAAIRKYGREAFTCESIDTADTIYELNEKEREWIQKLNTQVPNGFNDTSGGGGCINTRGKKLIIDGQEFPSIADAAEYFGVNLDNAYNRINLGDWTLEQVFELEPRYDDKNTTGRPVEFTFEGKKYSYGSLREAADAHGVNVSTAEGRWEKNWPIEEILELVPHDSQIGRDGNEISFELDGTAYEFKSLAAACEAFGQKQTRVEHRIKELGWSIQKALNTSKQTPSGIERNFVVNGKKYEFSNLREACRHFNISYDAVSNRIEKGMSVGEALTTPVRKKQKECRFVHNGKQFVFPSLKKACDEFGSNYQTVKARVNKMGWNIGKAITTPCQRPRKVSSKK